MTDDECTCPMVPPEWHLAISCGPPRDEDCSIHGACSYCGDTGWVWINAVECNHCEYGAALARRDPDLIAGGHDSGVAVVEVD